MIIKQIWSYFNKFKNLIKSNSGIIDELNSPKNYHPAAHITIKRVSTWISSLQSKFYVNVLSRAFTDRLSVCLSVFQKDVTYHRLNNVTICKTGSRFFIQILFKMRKKYPLKVYDRIQNDNMIDCLQMLIYKIIILGGRTYSNLIT